MCIDSGKIRSILNRSINTDLEFIGKAKSSGGNNVSQKKKKEDIKK